MAVKVEEKRGQPRRSESEAGRASEGRPVIAARRWWRFRSIEGVEGRRFVERRAEMRRKLNDPAPPADLAQANIKSES